MQSRFKHQHVVDYMEAHKKLSKALYGKSLADQVKFALDVLNSVVLGCKLRGGNKANNDRNDLNADFTDTEWAQIAACDEHLYALTGLDPVEVTYELGYSKLDVVVKDKRLLNPKSVDPTTRGEFVVIIGKPEDENDEDEEEYDEDGFGKETGLDRRGFDRDGTRRQYW